MATILIVLVALLVQVPYLKIPHFSDDQNHLQLLARWQLGEVSTLEYVLWPHNEHVLPVWRCWYLVMWRVAGLWPVPWQVSIALSQACGAVALGLVLRRAGLLPISALVGALLWAMQSVGSWDNPRIWIAASHLTFALNLMLVAVAVAVCGRSWRAMLALAWMTAIAVLTMKAVVVLAPLALLMRWAIQWRRGELDRVAVAARWLIAWVIGVAVAMVILHQAAQSNTVSVKMEVNAALPSTVAALVVSAATRMAGFTATPANWVAIGAVVLVICAGLVYVGRAHALWLAILAAALLAYSAGVAAVRGSVFPLSYMLDTGRYAFVPLIFFCALMAVGFDRLLVSRAVGAANRDKASPDSSAPGPSLLAVQSRAWVVFAVLIAAGLGLQMWQGERAQKTFEAMNARVINLGLENGLVIEQLAADQASSGTLHDVSLPDLLVFNPPLLFSLREMAALHWPGDTDLRIVPGQQVQDTDWNRLRDHLETGSTGQHILWQQLLARARELHGLLLACSTFAAEQTPEKEIRIPEIIVGQAPMNERLSRWSSSLFFQGLPGVQIVPASKLNDADKQRLGQFIAQFDPRVTGPVSREILLAWRSVAKTD